MGSRHTGHYKNLQEVTLKKDKARQNHLSQIVLSPFKTLLGKYVIVFTLKV